MCNELFEGRSLEEACAFCAEVGYEGVELAPYTFAPEGVEGLAAADMVRVRRAVRSAGLEVVGLHWLLLGPAGVHLTAEEPEVRRRTARYLEALVACCAELGGSILVLGSPRQRSLPLGTARAEGLRRAAEALAGAVAAAASAGVRWALEPLPAPDTNFLNTLDDCLELDRLLGGGPALGVQIDAKSLCAEAGEGGDPADVVRAHAASAGRFAHVHANDRNLAGPGEGDTAFGPLLGALRAAGYDGWVSVEAFRAPRGIESTARTALRCLRAAAGGA